MKAVDENQRLFLYLKGLEAEAFGKKASFSMNIWLILNDHKHMRKDKSIAFFSGGGLGIAVGIFMGLATSPTVGVVIGAIASSLAIFLGFGDGEHSHIKSIRIGAFGIMAAIFALLGVYIRANNLLSPSLESLKAQYMELGFEEQEALDFIKFKEFGILQEGWRMAGGDSTAGANQQSGRSLLFSSGAVTRSDCEKFDFNEFTSLKIILNNLSFLDESWKKMANEVQKQFSDEEEQRKILLFLSQFACDSRASELKCGDLSQLDDSSNNAQVLNTFNALGAIGKEVTSQSAQFSDQKKVLLLLANTLCNEN